MPEYVKITQETINQHPHSNSGYLDNMFRPKYLRCGLCMPPGTKEERRRQKKHILPIGSVAVKVKFRNGTVGYYALQCWNNPKYHDRVANILKQESKATIQR